MVIHTEKLGSLKLEIISTIPTPNKYGVKEFTNSNKEREYECFECLALVFCDIKAPVENEIIAKGVPVYLYLNSEGDIIPELVNGDDGEFCTDAGKKAIESLLNGIELVGPVFPVEKIKEDYLKYKEQGKYAYFKNK